MKTHDFLFLLLLFLFSCKKQKETPSNQPLPESETPISSSSNYDALFCTTKLYTKNAGSYALTGSQSFAFYSSKLINNELYYSNDLVNMGTVSLNSVIFKNKSLLSDFYYNDTSFTFFNLPYFWKVLGSTSVDSFSYSNPNQPPTFAASINISDSVQKSAGLTVHLKGLSNCDLIRILLLGGNGNSSSISKLIAGTDTIVTISPTELESFATTNSAYFSVQLFKDNYRKINTKKINFRSAISFNNSSFKIKS